MLEFTFEKYSFKGTEEEILRKLEKFSFKKVVVPIFKEVLQMTELTGVNQYSKVLNRQKFTLKKEVVK